MAGAEAVAEAPPAALLAQGRIEELRLGMGESQDSQARAYACRGRSQAVVPRPAPSRELQGQGPLRWLRRGWPPCPP